MLGICQIIETGEVCYFCSKSQGSFVGKTLCHLKYGWFYNSDQYPIYDECSSYQAIHNDVWFPSGLIEQGYENIQLISIYNISMERS